MCQRMMRWIVFLLPVLGAIHSPPRHHEHAMPDFFIDGLQRRSDEETLVAEKRRFGVGRRDDGDRLNDGFGHRNNNFGQLVNDVLHGGEGGSGLKKGSQNGMRDDETAAIRMSARKDDDLGEGTKMEEEVETKQSSDGPGVKSERLATKPSEGKRLANEKNMMGKVPKQAGTTLSIDAKALKLARDASRAEKTSDEKIFSDRTATLLRDVMDRDRRSSGSRTSNDSDKKHTTTMEPLGASRKQIESRLKDVTATSVESNTLAEQQRKFAASTAPPMASK
eukprot:TRINITY_DN50379_c0_g1_i1.p1 TRINITY_DN50379_c0_g1~~TRINITY_DN50379_c0_g1_i1.p1  ORF type:complete len:279 (-),score=67.36 TRINITY_DN50379_c0_g1_i1:29-865(-)